jgi:hypothetical protein
MEPSQSYSLTHDRIILPIPDLSNEVRVAWFEILANDTSLKAPDDEGEYRPRGGNGDGFRRFALGFDIFAVS